MKSDLPRQYRFDEINDMDMAAFITVLGGVFEDSPWVAEAAWRSIPFEGCGDVIDKMCGVVRTAGRDRQLALLRAHPELGTNKRLTRHSEREQKNAGLKGGEDSRVELLAEMNERYRDKFGFPFILAVKGLSPDKIMERLQARLENNREDEFNECLEQVFRIAKYRLEAMLVDKDNAATAGSLPP